MFKAVWRLFRTIGYFFTGRINKSREAWQTDPAVIAQTYDEIKSAKIASLNSVQKAMAMIVSLQDKQTESLRSLQGEITSLNKTKNGAFLKASDRKKALEGQATSPEHLKELLSKDSDYLKCRTAYQDMQSTLESKNSEIQRLESEVSTIHAQIEKYKIDLQQMSAEIRKIEGEKSTTIADIQFAKHKKQINDMISGISTDDKTGEMRIEMQNLRRQIQNETKVSEIIAGTDANEIAKDFEMYAEKKQSADEFDSLIFGSEQSVEQTTGLPEA